MVSIFILVPVSTNSVAKVSLNFVISFHCFVFQCVALSISFLRSLSVADRVCKSLCLAGSFARRSSDAFRRWCACAELSNSIGWKHLFKCVRGDRTGLWKAAETCMKNLPPTITSGTVAWKRHV